MPSSETTAVTQGIISNEREAVKLVVLSSHSILSRKERDPVEKMVYDHKEIVNLSKQLDFYGFLLCGSCSKTRLQIQYPSDARSDGNYMQTDSSLVQYGYKEMWLRVNRGRQAQTEASNTKQRMHEKKRKKKKDLAKTLTTCYCTDNGCSSKNCVRSKKKKKKKKKKTKKPHQNKNKDQKQKKKKKKECGKKYKIEKHKVIKLSPYMIPLWDYWTVEFIGSKSL
ncbi:hypothetical protein llap_12137 [Limosa lapponica baueri]|uniref:Uncharacterized protein n=1 Tax=Limosa lapponica baueri TaxID=1758121 RepID=A0A2I0TUQ6_LIMLA|nr:hypothetical protein llap_12137 [Limosa lapponica baueri]